MLILRVKDEEKEEEEEEVVGVVEEKQFFHDPSTGFPASSLRGRQ